MIRLLKFLITGSWHEHIWETIKTINVYESSSPRDDELPFGTKYILKCKHCGKIKSKEV